MASAFGGIADMARIAAGSTAIANGPVADIDLHKTTLLSHQISFF